jgi:hypothetical protein
MIREFFGFRKMIAGRLIKIIYLLGALAVTIFSFVLMFAPVLFRGGVYFPGGGRPVEIYIARIITGVVVLIIGNVIWRIVCEYSIILFSMHEGIWKLVHNEENKIQ